MKLEELLKKRVWHHSFDDSFPEIERAIVVARDNLETLDPPVEAYTMRKYYPHNYDNSWDQACYVMRYLYAYAYEYFMLFSDTLEMVSKSNSLQVISLGCGTMPDAWALQEAADRMEIKGPIEYTGVDMFEWPSEYVPQTNKEMKRTFIKSKAGEYLLTCNDQAFDVILFPKSLGDMYKNDRSDLFMLKKALGEILPLKEEFFLAFSFIDNEQENRKDKIEMDYLLQCIRDRGYVGEPIKNRYTKVGICNSYPPFPMLDDDLIKDSKRLALQHFMTSREHENYYICKFTKVK